jgi:hypothetical protein
MVMLINGCISKEEKQKEEVIKFVNQYFSLKNISNPQYIIILPNQGCIGCITIAENFLIENASDSRCTFILTSIVSMKVLKTKLGNDISALKNVHFDKENFLGSNIKQLIYPIVIWQENGYEVLYFQKPGEVAFDKLKKKLEN